MSSSASATPPEGQSNVWHVGRSATTPSSVGNPLRDGYQGTTTPYKIENGKVVTTISQDPFAVTIYKLGDTYYGARSNEFGYRQLRDDSDAANRRAIR